MELLFFPTPADFREWLRKNHAQADELWVGYHKKGTGKPSLTWSESVEEALCYGWIDGLRQKVDGEAYAIRFTPRRSGSSWSARNVQTVEHLIAQKRMRAAGLKAYRDRAPSATAVPPRERSTLDPAFEKILRSNRQVWAFLQSQPPGYRRLTGQWVMAAQKEETQRKRLAVLIEDSAAGRRIKPLR
jgi:uncharacterized protein YdeI (YjbR/CyaY-like superfamily)